MDPRARAYFKNKGVSTYENAKSRKLRELESDKLKRVGTGIQMRNSLIGGLVANGVASAAMSMGDQAKERKALLKKRLSGTMTEKEEARMKELVTLRKNLKRDITILGSNSGREASSLSTL